MFIALQKSSKQIGSRFFDPPRRKEIKVFFSLWSLVQNGYWLMHKVPTQFLPALQWFDGASTNFSKVSLKYVPESRNEIKINLIQVKVEKIWEDSLDLIPSPSTSVNIQIIAVKFTWGNKEKHCWVLFLKVCWQRSAMFFLYTSSKL